MSGISFRIKDAPRGPLVLSSMCGHNEKVATYELRSGLSSNTKSVGTLVLVFLAFRTVRNKCCLSAIQSMAFCHSSPNRLRHKYVYLKVSSYCIMHTLL